MKFIAITCTILFMLAKVCYAGNEVIVYTSEDKIFSEPVLQAFEKKDGNKGHGYLRYRSDQEHRIDQPFDFREG